MRLKILLTLAGTALASLSYAQKNKQLTAFAITGPQKGQNNWTEVRLVDMNTGSEVRPVYQSAQDVELLNARTGKPIVKKDPAADNDASKEVIQVTRRDPDNNFIIVEKKTISFPRVSYDKPFSTNSAACAYDKKHERLYYTPMGIAQLRYIDLKSKTPKIYYFENESFGVLTNPRDVSNQITRMVIGSDGNGYALTNNAKHLIRFTTGKDPVVTDLGEVSDDGANTAYSVHTSNSFGGDMIADAKGNLYLITANHNVFRFAPDTRIANYMGTIKGLPKGYSTNGAMVEAGSMVIVCSSNSTEGYFHFDLNTMNAEKISGAASVFNASDLANGNLAFEKEKKKKDRKDPVVDPQHVVLTDPTSNPPATALEKQKTLDAPLSQISVYPNPVTNGSVKLSFANQPEGKYHVQFMDISGRVISSQDVVIGSKMQVEEFRIPTVMTSGNYLVKVVSEANNISILNKLVVYQ